MKEELTEIKNRNYSGEEVVLDGHSYEGCTFESCVFVYSATAEFGLTSNSISGDCGFRFDGAASDTVNTMRAIYSMGEWGRNHIQATFKNIAPNLKLVH